MGTYIGPNSTFPPRLWAAPPTTGRPRTTNGPESYHRHLKDQFHSPHAQVHHVIDALLQLQSETYVKMNHASPRKNTQHQEWKHSAFNSLWDKYQRGRGQITLKEYVQKIGIRNQATELH